MSKANITERASNILPQIYEYKILTRPEESSADPSAHPVKAVTSLIQEYLLGYVYKISESSIKEHCETNAFQTHYYRDVIIPVFSSSYFPVICDTTHGTPRDLLMVASPRKKERICISTMALDWAGHLDLLEHIINYITRGIPTIGFIDVRGNPNNDMNLLIEQAELARIPFEHYDGIEKFIASRLRKFHSLIIFSPVFSEDEVGKNWAEIKKDETKLLRAYYYKKIGDDFTLVKFSNNSLVEPQKNDCFTWLASKYNEGLWDNNFWKTYDVLFTMHELKYKNIIHYLPSAIKAFVSEKHYKEGSYDYVCEPTCGLFIFLCLIKEHYIEIAHDFDINNYIEQTQKWLFIKYSTTSSYNNKQLIISSLFSVKRLNDFKKYLLIKNLTLESELKEILAKEEGDFVKRYEIDICLTIDICLLIMNECKDKESVAKARIYQCLEILVNNRRQENGKWENLSTSAIVLISLLRNKNRLLELYTSRNEMIEKIKKAIDTGIFAIRRDYNKNECNWENNIVTTANALKAIVLYDNQAGNNSKDFLNDFLLESNGITTNNSLELALDTLGKRTATNYQVENERDKAQEENEWLNEKIKRTSNKLYFMTVFAVVFFLLTISLYIFLYFKDTSEGKTLFTSMILEPLMWIPVAVAFALTTLITVIVKKITNEPDGKNTKNQSLFGKTNSQKWGKK